MTGFDSIQVRFKNTEHRPSPLVNTQTVPFVESYLEVLKSVIDDISTEYFWFFANFVDLKSIDIDFIPEQHEIDQIHVWYNKNKEGNIFLIPTKQLKEQIHNLKFLRDYKDINYHRNDTIIQNNITKKQFSLAQPYEALEDTKENFYTWLYNKDLKKSQLPNFYPSFWEDIKLYTWGKTNDIMLVPNCTELKQFYDIDRIVHYDLDYKVRPMDIIFISYDEPGASERFEKLKQNYPRAKWCKNIQGQTKAYHTAASMSDTDYFFAVFPKIDLVDSFDFTFQPDRLKNPSHYIFDCYNEVIDCTYGHDGVILYNKRLVLDTTEPGLDFTMSQSVTTVPILSAINKLDETSLLAWRTAFREVIKLKLQKQTVENNFRLKKWTTIGKGNKAEWVHKGAMDAVDFLNNGNDPFESYNFDTIKKIFEEKYG
tara:strand:+ start:1977 stop:3254 length:1278 start_codon:yes stop_codon:yes gene_type:complete